MKTPSHRTSQPAGKSRREFLRSAGAAGAAASITSGFTIMAQEAKGANERIGVGFIGTGGRCQAHINICKQFESRGVTQPVAVCDVYGPRLDAAAQKTGGKPYRKHEDLLADPNVDAVCIASPDRHHAPQAIDAVNAGKDVYCEKPLVHWSQLALARQLAEQTAKNQRVVQVGTQYMADPAYGKIRQLIEEGVVGKIVHVQAGFFRRGDWGERMHIPDANAQPGPELDWDRFLGDAPKVPFDVSRFFQWRLYWDYAGGPATDLLVHTFTPVFAVLNLDFPERVLGGGGTFQYNREVPDQCNIIADYPEGPSVVMLNSLSNFTGVDTMLRGTNGIIIWKDITHGDSKGVRIVPNGKEEIFIPWSGKGDTTRLWANFLECIKTRQQPLSHIDLAVRVQAPLNMGIIAHRENSVVRYDPDTQEIVV